MTEVTDEHIKQQAKLRVESFRTTPGISFDVGNDDGTTSYPNHLEWWTLKARDFPLLAVLSRRMLAIPASQARSDRVFSRAGQIVIKSRNKLEPENVELLVYLRSTWAVVEQWKANQPEEGGA